MDTEKRKEKFLLAPLIVLMMTQIGTTGDNGLLSISANSLIEHFSITMNEIQLANIIYPLCAGAFMITGGMLGVAYGWKRVYRTGLIFAVAGELVLTFTNSFNLFIWVGRMLVGLGGSLMIPSVLGLVAGIYSGKDRAIAFGAIGAASGLATVAPILMGFILDKFGYKVGFGVMAAYFFIVLILSGVIPEVERTSKDLKLDLKGVIISTLGIFLFLIGLSKISSWGLIRSINPPFKIFGLSPSIFFIVAGILLMIVLLRLEEKVEKENGFALIPQSFIKTRQVRNGIYASALCFFSMGAFNVSLIPYLQVVDGFNGLQTGFYMMGMGIPLFIFSLIIPKYFTKLTSKMTIRIGYLLMAISSIPLIASLRAQGTNHIMFLLGVMILGISQGFISSKANTIVANAVNERDSQQSGGIQATARNIGQAIGVALVGTVLLGSLTITTNSMIKSRSNEISARTEKVLLEEKQHIFMSDVDYMSNLESKSIPSEDHDTLLEINKEARVKSTRYSILAMAIVALIFLLGTGGIEE